jgi:hypothetical protein
MPKLSSGYFNMKKLFLYSTSEDIFNREIRAKSVRGALLAVKKAEHVGVRLRKFAKSGCYTCYYNKTTGYSITITEL